MEITCPQCRFTRTIIDEKIPERAEIATCPKCKHKFRFRTVKPDQSTDSAVQPLEQPVPASPDQRPEKADVSFQTASNTPEQKPRDGEEFWDKLASMGQPHQESSQEVMDDIEVEVPWERLDKYGFFPGLWETIKRAMFQPAAFFQAMPLGGGQIKPLTFYLLIAVFQIVMQILWDKTGMGTDATGDAGAAGINAMTLLLIYPVMLTALLYIMALLVHACLNLVGVVTRGFEGTFRALTYGSAPMIMVLVPMIGPLVGAVWSLVVTFLGYKHIHRATTGKVLVAMLLPLIPFALLLIFVLLMGHGDPGQQLF